MSDNWIVEILESGFSYWNGKLAELWELAAMSPEDFKGGQLWKIMSGINGSLQAIGLALLVLFLAMGIYKSAASFRDFQRPEYAFKFFIRFIVAKGAVTYSLPLLLTLFDICGGAVNTVAGGMGDLSAMQVTLPDTIRTAIEETSFLMSIPLWIVALLGNVLIIFLSISMILTVYGRFFRLYMYTAAAPVALSSLAGEGTETHGKAFLRSYIGVCLEGAIVILACIIFSAFVSVEPDTSGATSVVQVFSYMVEVVFNLLVLVGTVKASDRLAREMFGL